HSPQINNLIRHIQLVRTWLIPHPPRRPPRRGTLGEGNRRSNEDQAAAGQEANNPRVHSTFLSDGGRREGENAVFRQDSTEQHTWRLGRSSIKLTDSWPKVKRARRSSL